MHPRIYATSLAAALVALPVSGCALEAAGGSSQVSLQGGPDVHGISEGSDEALAVLELVNTAPLETLDDEVPLDRRAAAGIIDGRPFASLAQLDEVRYVAATAFARLLEYALAHADPVAAPIAVPIHPHDAFPLFPSVDAWPHHLLLYFGVAELADYEAALAHAGLAHQDIVSYALIVDDWTTSNRWLAAAEVAAFLEDQAGAALAEIEANPGGYGSEVERGLAVFRLMRDHVFELAAQIPELAEASSVRDVEIVLDIPPVHSFNLFEMPSVTYHGKMYLYDRDEFTVPIKALDPWTRQRLHDNERIAKTLPYATHIKLRVPTGKHGRVTPIGIINDAYWVSGY